MTEAGPWRVCAIGLGQHGLNTLRQLLSNPSRWQVVSVADTSAAAYARFQARFHDLRIPCFTTPVEALAYTPADVVYVATTAPSHVAVATAALTANGSKRLLIEKPISTSVLEADSLLQLAKRAQPPVQVGVNFNRRCSALYGNVKRMIESGEMGRLLNIEYRRRMKVSMKGSHYIDLANWYMQAAPVGVSARLDDLSKVDSRGAFFFDPEGWIEAEYPDGRTFCMDATGSRAQALEGMTVRFERGEVFIDAEESFARITAPAGAKEMPSDKVAFGYNWVENTFAALAANGGQAAVCTLEESIAALEVLVAAHLSSRSGGRRVPLPLAADQRAEVLRVA